MVTLQNIHQANLGRSDIEFIYFYLHFKNNKIGTSFTNNIKSLDVIINKPVKMCKYFNEIKD